MLGSLDTFGQFSKNTVSQHGWRWENGNFVTENLAYTEIEQHLHFRERGTMEVTVEKQESETILILKTDCFPEV